MRPCRGAAYGLARLPNRPAIDSLAPPSIFAVISALAAEHGAVNLGQGFPDFAPDEALVDRLVYHVRHSSNQYAPPAGVPALLRAIAHKTARTQGADLDPATEITITSGATQALWTAIQCVVGPGDEVIVFEPAYDSYAPAVRSMGGTVVPLTLRGPDFRIDWEAFAKTRSARTRLVIINNPHNPTGRCLRADDLAALERLLRSTETYLLSDEVYEHLTYDGREHLSVLRYPELRRRAFVTCSFGKTFHVTGWKVGYVVAPPGLTQRFRAMHQFTVFTVNTPAQHAIADHLADPSTYETLPGFFAAKRDRLTAALGAIEGLRPLPSEGSYFMLADYSAISRTPDTDFAEALIRHAGVATIPISPFYSAEPPADQHYLRLCFAKTSATLDAAAERLQVGLAAVAPQ